MRLFLDENQVAHRMRDERAVMRNVPTGPTSALDRAA
jgi:hypothetical protein